MKELLPQISEWRNKKKKFVLARVIQTWGSSPRPVGSSMIISEDMEMAGSVSGGCVEGSVIKEVKQILENGNAKRLSYGVSDDDAWSVGLTCGGKIQVYMQPYLMGAAEDAKVWERLQQLLQTNKACVLITALLDGETKNTLIDKEGMVLGYEMPDEILAKAKQCFAERRHESVSVGEVQYFVQVFSRRSQLYIVGAAHVASNLVQLAHGFDFETIVIDPRIAFTRNTYFSQVPDKILEEYPSKVLNDVELDAYAYAAILSHDPKIDDNALHTLLRSNVGYIGAIGSRATHEKRKIRLRQAGFLEDEINRIESPIGVDIKAQGAKEIALSIMGSIIKAKNAYL